MIDSRGNSVAPTMLNWPKLSNDQTGGTGNQARTALAGVQYPQSPHEIAPGRSVLKALGGGHDYEVYLVWDDHLFSIMVAKLLRPDRFDDEKALRSLAREAATYRPNGDHDAAS